MQMILDLCWISLHCLLYIIYVCDAAYLGDVEEGLEVKFSLWSDKLVESNGRQVAHRHLNHDREREREEGRDGEREREREGGREEGSW